MPETIPTREIFRNFPFLMQLIFYLVSFGAMGVFFYGFYLRIKKYRRGKPDYRFNNLGKRFMKGKLRMLSGEHYLLRDPSWIISGCPKRDKWVSPE